MATAAFLAELERHFGASCHKQFDLFAGTSTGAIIALALASGRTASEVADLYEDFGPRVFRSQLPRQVRWIKGALVSIYGNRGLRQSLNETFDDLTFRDLQAKGKMALIPTLCLNTGSPRVFKTDHSLALTRHSGYRIADVALAASAAPVFLPVVELRSPLEPITEHLVDGGLFANNPSLLALTEALCYLRTPPSAIQLLSISTPRTNAEEHPAPLNSWQRFRLRRGMVGWGSKLTARMIDSTSASAARVAELLANSPALQGIAYRRIVLPNPTDLSLDDATPAATATLRRIGCEQASDNALRDSVTPFFQRQEVP